MALEFACQAYEIEPNSEEVLCVLGTALSHAGQDEEAEETFFRTASLFPKSAKARYNLAVHYYRWGRKEEAWEYVRSAWQLAPLHPGVRDLLPLLEEERKLPPVKEAPVDVSVSSSTQPGIVSETGEKADLLLPRAEHLNPVMQAWGPKWDAGLWVSFVLWMGLSFWLMVELVSQGGSLNAMAWGKILLRWWGDAYGGDVANVGSDDGFGFDRPPAAFHCDLF